MLGTQPFYINFYSLGNKL